jgi:steroid delta-isomerase-like uncharacterized protein
MAPGGIGSAQETLWAPDLRPVGGKGDQAGEATGVREEGANAHARIAVYQFRPGATEEEVYRLTREGSLPVYRQQPGFVAYEGIHAEGDTWVSITTWESAAHADAATERIAAWIRETPEAATLVRSRDQQWIGRLVFSFRGQLAEEQNVSTVMAFCEGYNRHDVEAIMGACTEDVVAVYPTLARHPKDVWAGLLAEELEAFPDASLRIEDVIAQGDKVTLEWGWTATHKGEFRGVPPTNRTFDVPGTFLFEQRDGRIALVKYYWNTRLWDLHEPAPSGT